MTNLEQLAEKLGVNIEMLWQALLRQAPISAVFDLAQYVLVAFMVYGAVKFYRWARVNADDLPDGIWPFFGVVVVVVLVLLLGLIHSMQFTVAAFLNPEYWALRQVLKHLGK